MTKKHICKFYPRKSIGDFITYQCSCGIYKHFKTPQKYLAYCEKYFPTELAYFWRKIDTIINEKIANERNN